MRGFGELLIAAGVVGLLVAMNMDTTVEVPGQPGQTIGSGEFSTYIPPVPSQRVHNIGLMDERRNWLIVLGFVLVSGFILLGSGSTVNKGNMEARNENSLGDGGNPLTVYTTLDDIAETSEVSKIEESDLDRVLRGETLPPKFDEWGHPLQPTSVAGSLTEFLRSE